MLYKYDNFNYLEGEYPENANGNVPNGFTLVIPPSYQTGEIPLFDGQSWGIALSNIGAIYYREDNGEGILWTYHHAPTSFFQLSEPTISYPIWDGMQWIEDTTLRHETEISLIVCDLPNGLLVPLSLKEKLLSAILQLDTLVTTEATVEGVTYREVEIEYILAYFEFEIQRIYNS